MKLEPKRERLEQFTLYTWLFFLNFFLICKEWNVLFINNEEINSII